MINNNFVFIILLLIGLLVVIVLFALVDRVIKGGSSQKTFEKKSTPNNSEQEKPAPKPVEVSKEDKTHVMKIYNSELADDLNKMIKESATTDDSRLNLKNHIVTESNISKYISEKKYHGFDFDGIEVEDLGADSDDTSMKFSREDYKKFMALSNIDEKKPL